jgi:hypothetical protein
VHRDGEIERLKSIINQLQRAQFGRRSERLDPDQLAVGLEGLEGDLARERENRPRVEKQPTERSPHRKPLPNHLPREDVRLDIGNITRDGIKVCAHNDITGCRSSPRHRRCHVRCPPH